jgi:hypothetical protein
MFLATDKAEQFNRNAAIYYHNYLKKYGDIQANLQPASFNTHPAPYSPPIL